MSIRRSIGAASLVVAMAACSFPGAELEHSGKAVQARMLEHRRLTELGERTSRAMAPSVAPAAPSTSDGTIRFPINHIIQFAINTTLAVPLAKQFSPLPSSVPPCPYTPGQTPPMRTASLVKIFPEMVWHVCVTDMGLKSLWVGPVHRAPTIDGPWTTVLHQAGLAEIFVPYHRSPLRLRDLAWTRDLLQVTPEDAGPTGSIVYLTNEAVPTVVAEVRDRGVAWLCKQSSMASRRGQELVLWGIADGGNYDNIVEYAFGDDGGITFRTGNTGYNSVDQPQEPHTHNALWRIDIDLNGAEGDVPWWLTHHERDQSPRPPGAHDTQLPIPREGARSWLGQTSSLLVTDITTNAFGNRQGYAFSPMQNMVSRHYDSNEAWTQNDVYITRYHPTELGWTDAPIGFPGPAPETYLMTYFDNEYLPNQDLVVWIKTAAHHHPTDEDRSANDRGTANTTGVTLAHWSGFKMEPYNLFNANPLGGPARCGS